MNSLPVIISVLCIFAIAYRYWSGFLAAKVATLDPSRPTPAHTNYDGQNYYPTNRFVLFGHHFAAITGAGPLIGPVLAAQFGFLPGLLWLVIGVVLAGAVHDFIILFASVRRGGKSLAEIAKQEIGPGAGIVTAISILFIVIIALSGLGLAVVNALSESSWGTFTITCTIPLALLMGIYIYRLHHGEHKHIVYATIFGVTGMFAAVIYGKFVPQAEWGHFFSLTRSQITLAIAAYGFIASVLPVWMLLCPRDYLSSYMKIGTIAFLVLGIIVVHPQIKMPNLTQFVSGGGPIIPGKVFPFVFITIACGAISGFHALVGSGTTPKMINNEMDIRPIGYGAMLTEGLVGVVSLIAACSMYQSDYFAINVPPEKFMKLGMDVVNLPELARQVGENVAGRTGGAVSLAIGMAQIFSGIPGMKHLMGYWYHFAIMFEALFILTTIDTGTRVARFILQEFLGRIYKPFEKTNWLPGNLIASLLVVSAWTYFILTGSITTIWPMFGIANQLLAVIALIVGTTVLINMGKARYAWVTLSPMCFVATTTLTAGWLSIRDNFLPMAKSSGVTSFHGYLNTFLTSIMMTAVVFILVNAILKWSSLLKKVTVPIIASITVIIACHSSSQAAETSASWLRPQTLPNALNPKISLIGDFVGKSGTANQTEDGLGVREVELGIQAEIDPYARADVFIGGLNDKDGSPELEEAFVTLLSLPLGLQARGGKFRVAFGRLNLTHPHEFAQVDAPFVLNSFLGEEGLNSTGFEVSRIFAPFGLYTEASYSILHDLGGEKESNPAVSQVKDVNGNIVNVTVNKSETASPQRMRSFGQAAKLRLYQDLTDTTNIDFGVSGALREPMAQDQTRMGAVDLTLRWKPLQQGVYRSFIWRSEGLYSDRKLIETLNPITRAVAEPGVKVHAWGGYSYMEFQPAMRWRFGMRGDYTDDPENRNKTSPHITRAVSPYITFTLTEFNRFRIQYQRKSLSAFNAGGHRKNENLGFFQWTIVLGPHGAHPF